MGPPGVPGLEVSISLLAGGGGIAWSCAHCEQAGQHQARAPEQPAARTLG
jgi:hypothetical protein